MIIGLSLGSFCLIVAVLAAACVRHHKHNKPSPPTSSSTTQQIEVSVAREPGSKTDKVIVTDVADGCAASGLGMKGDKVLAINGTPVTDEI